MMPMRKRFNTRQQIFESVESAMLEAISPQVLGISVVISSTRNVEISMFVQGILPAEDRDFLEVVMEEILYGPPWVADVKIMVLDNAIQPLAQVGTWLFIRKGVQADRDSLTSKVSQPVCQPTRRIARRRTDAWPCQAALHT